MGGGGTIGMMNSVIKNNRNLLKKRKKLKNMKGSFVPSEKMEFKTPDASPHALNRLRNKIQEEQKSLRQKQLIVSGFIIAIILSIILYFL